METKILSEKQQEEDPPGNLIIKNKVRRIKQLEPALRMGSFFVVLPAKKNEVEIVSDIRRCFNLWNEFSSQKSLFDTWEFRFAFYLGYKYKPYFLLLKNQKENLALLPLWYEKDKKKYFWFGSWWQEEVRFFSKDPNYIPILLNLAPSPLLLNAISEDSIEPLKNKIKFEEDDEKYILNLEGFRNHEDYLMTLKKNTRRNLRKDRRKVERLKPAAVINNFSDFDALVELSKKRFHDKGENVDWEDSRRVNTFRQVIKLAGKSYQTRMITIRVGEKIAGVDLIAIYNKTYLALKCGYNVKDFPGIGNFVNLFEIDDAINLGMEKIDFLQNDYAWKSRYFQAVPLFKFEKS